MLDEVWYLVKKDQGIELPTKAFISLEAAKRLAERREPGGTWFESNSHGECHLYSPVGIKTHWTQYIIPLEIQLGL